MAKEFDEIGFGGGKNTFDRLAEVLEMADSTFDISLLYRFQDELDLEVEEWRGKDAQLFACSK